MFSERISKYNFLISLLYHLFYYYPAPLNLHYFWNFGVYAFFCLFVQLVTGIFLAMYYISDVLEAFFSVEHIMRDVNKGWLLRYIHSNGASMFFIVVYFHISRGLFYVSYSSPRQLVWVVGVVIFFFMIITAFLGYVLPWGSNELLGVLQ